MRVNKTFTRACLIIAGLLLVAILVFASQSDFAWIASMMASFFLLLSIGVRHTYFKGLSYGMIILMTVSVAMGFPDLITSWGSFQTKVLIVPLLQLIMFGMGTSMSIQDFAAVTKSPKAVAIGLVCQLTIMPLIGFVLTIVFAFPPEIAAGIILVGSSPSGLASNVMAYLGRANLALSVTLTTVATLVAPLSTPLLMKVFGGQLVPMDFWVMMWSITKIVIIPIVFGLLFNKMFHSKMKWLDKLMPLVSMAGIVFIIAIITAAGRDNLLTIGLALLLACFIHNNLGYLLGYWSCRVMGLDEKSCRTVAFEVGMQNSGLASGIAVEMSRVATLGLAPAVFGPLMNISGSTLATWWRDRSVD